LKSKFGINFVFQQIINGIMIVIVSGHRFLQNVEVSSEYQLIIKHTYKEVTITCMINNQRQVRLKCKLLIRKQHNHCTNTAINTSNQLYFDILLSESPDKFETQDELELQSYLLDESDLEKSPLNQISTIISNCKTCVNSIGNIRIHLISYMGFIAGHFNIVLVQKNDLIYNFG
jgi:hypothetical protein